MTQPINLLWFIPTHGDSRYLGTAEGGRAVTLSYVTQIAQAADRLGYYGVLLPTGRSCEDSWVVASSLIAATQNLRFLIALRPGLMQPSVAARMAASFDRLSGGRLLLNVVTGGDPVELAGDGLFESHDARYAITDEFLTIWRRLMAGETVDFSGDYLKAEGGRLAYPPLQQPTPPLYFGGSSDAGHLVAAKHVDHYLTWGEPPDAVRAKIATVRAKAAEQGRTLKFGIRLHVIVRETTGAAWDAANDLIRYVDDQKIAEAQKVMARMDSVGQQRMVSLHQGRRDRLEISPNLWAGVGLVRGGAGTALVGDAQTVAARLREYADLGIESFILSGYPHLEEAYRTAELLFPHLPLAHATGDERLGQTGFSGPFGEIIANDIIPARSQS